MSHERRVFVPLSSHNPGTEVHLAEEDAHHFRTVLRLQPGDPVTVVDRNSQVEFESFVSSSGSPFVIKLGQSMSKSIPNHTVRGLLIALCKNRANDIIAEKATELGVEYILFWQADRSVVRYTVPEDREKRAERLQKIAEEASKQSARSSVPKVQVMENLAAALKVVKSYASSDERYFYGSLSSDAQPLPQLPPLLTRANVLIGPEGDITAAEELLIRTFGFEPFTLGSTRLRSETAACAAITAIDIFGSLSR